MIKKTEEQLDTIEKFCSLVESNLNNINQQIENDFVILPNGITAYRKEDQLFNEDEDAIWDKYD